MGKASARGQCGHDPEPGGGNRRRGRLKRNNNRRKVGENKWKRTRAVENLGKKVMQPTLDADLLITQRGRGKNEMNSFLILAFTSVNQFLLL